MYGVREHSVVYILCQRGRANDADDKNDNNSTMETKSNKSKSKAKSRRDKARTRSFEAMQAARSKDFCKSLVVMESRG